MIPKAEEESLSSYSASEIRANSIIPNRKIKLKYPEESDVPIKAYPVTSTVTAGNSTVMVKTTASLKCVQLCNGR
jgi:hypothetical protein